MGKKQHMEVRLRAMESEDPDMFYYTENDRSLWNISATNVSYNRYALHNYIADVKNDIYIDGQLRMMIENREQGIVGVIDLINFDPKHQRAEMGIIIMRPFRQKDYAQAVISALIDYTCNGLRFKQIYTVVDADSEVSVRCLSSIGFTNGSILREWLYCNGQRRNVRVMQLFI